MVPLAQTRSGRRPAVGLLRAGPVPRPTMEGEGVMPLLAWLMMIFGAVVLYGGLAICLSIACRKSQQATFPADEGDAQ